MSQQIRRPFRLHNNQPAAGARAVHPDGSGRGWIAWWGIGPFTAEQTARAYPGEHGIPPPFGGPGSVIEIEGRALVIVSVRVEPAGAGWEWVYEVEDVSS